jgi:hypothetical protein
VAAVVLSAVLFAGVIIVWLGMEALAKTAESGTIHVGAFIFLCLVALLALGGGAVLTGWLAGPRVAALEAMAGTRMRRPPA